MSGFFSIFAKIKHHFILRMKNPNYIKSGDTIGIAAPAGKIDMALVDVAKTVFESWGLQVVVGKSVEKQYFQFAGTDEERFLDMQSMINNDTIKAIVCARGGYGTIRLMEQLSFKKFRRKPKWLVGFSDITVLHAYINNALKIPTIHGPMPKNFKTATPDSIESLKKSLFGEKIKYSVPAHDLNRKGNASGILVGGNLSILYSLAKTKYDCRYRNKILFIEDLNEPLYHIDRMMHSMKMRGVFNKLHGLVVGGMTDIKDTKETFGKDAYEIIRDTVKDYKFPVCFGFPAGHFENNHALIMGRQISLQVSEKGTELFYS